MIIPKLILFVIDFIHVIFLKKNVLPGSSANGFINVYLLHKHKYFFKACKTAES